MKKFLLLAVLAFVASLVFASVVAAQEEQVGEDVEQKLEA